MAKVELPAGPQELSASWLTSALRETGTITDSSVSAFTCETIGEGVGVLGQLARVRLEYDSPETEAPASLVGKFPAPVQANRALANLFRFYEREVRFYEEIANEVELRTPTRYYSRFDPETSDYVLLMEDMHPAECGDQVAGCPVEVATSLLHEMARFHATWWESRRLPSLEWIPLGDAPVMQFAEQAYKGSLPRFLDVFGSELQPRAISILERFQDKVIALQHVINKPPLTIAHGDLRFDNLYLGPNGTAVGDWQIIQRSRGAYDVGYFLSQSIDTAARRTSEMEILRGYHETLVENGVKNYTFDQCFNDYRAFAMFCLVYPVISGGTLDLANDRGVELVQTMATRSIATILDLDCDKMIPA